MPAVMEEAGSTTPLPPESFREQSENTTGDNRLLLTQCPAISDNNKNDDDDDDDKLDSDDFATTPELHILCTTLHPYTAQGPGEMSLEAKDLVRILRKDESGWWYGLLLKPAVLVRRGTDCSTTDENCTECSEQQQQQEINVDAESEEPQQQQQEQLKQKHEQRKSGRWVVVAEGWCPSNFLKVLMTSEQAHY
jgi:hypothetical protein